MVLNRKPIVKQPKDYEYYGGRVLVRTKSGKHFSYKLLEENYVPCFECLLRIPCDTNCRYSCFMYMEALEEYGDIHRYA